VHAHSQRNEVALLIDLAGDSLSRRGYRLAGGEAPLRENIAAGILMRAGWPRIAAAGGEFLDPMCGSGTFVIEAAEIAARLNPGRGRHFAFEQLATFDAEAWEKMRAVRREVPTTAGCHGSDRDAGAIAMSLANAERAGVAEGTVFRHCAISDVVPPGDVPGLVIVNAPYGNRLGDSADLLPLYQALGGVLTRRFAGWRVGLITTEQRLARATGLNFLPTSAPVPHGGQRVTLYRTDALSG
jgi:putative N6-adenine-specific DNA methylase